MKSAAAKNLRDNKTNNLLHGMSGDKTTDFRCLCWGFPNFCLRSVFCSARLLAKFFCHLRVPVTLFGFNHVLLSVVRFLYEAKPSSLVFPFLCEAQILPGVLFKRRRVYRWKGKCKPLIANPCSLHHRPPGFERAARTSAEVQKGKCLAAL